MKIRLLLTCAFLLVSCGGGSDDSETKAANGSGGSSASTGGSAGGSSTKGGEANAGGSAGTSASTVPAQAGLSLEIGEGCSTTSTTHSVGAPSPGATSPGTPVVDGHDGAKITCSVSGDNVFNVEASLTVDDMSFSVFAELSPNATAAGAVKIQAPENVALIDEKCELLPIDLNQGSAWVKFDCNLTQSSTAACSGTGYFVLQDCAN